MRVNETPASKGRAVDAAAVRCARFGDALRRARAGSASARATAAESGATARPARTPHPLRRQQAEAIRREAARDEERAAVAGDTARAGRPAEIAAVPEIAALVRAVPVAIGAARAQDGMPLALSFGRSLDVELRAGAGGIEVLLRPDPRLLRAAESEMPRLVAALRLRGVDVVRAEVRARGGAGRPR